MRANATVTANKASVRRPTMAEDETGTAEIKLRIMKGTTESIGASRLPMERAWKFYDRWSYLSAEEGPSFRMGNDSLATQPSNPPSFLSPMRKSRCTFPTPPRFSPFLPADTPPLRTWAKSSGQLSTPFAFLRLQKIRTAEEARVPLTNDRRCVIF